MSVFFLLASEFSCTDLRSITRDNIFEDYYNIIAQRETVH